MFSEQYSRRMVQYTIPHKSELFHDDRNVISRIFRHTTAFDTQPDGFQHLVTIYVLQGQVTVPELLPTESRTVAL